jgi:hypothetical protein
MSRLPKPLLSVALLLGFSASGRAADDTPKDIIAKAIKAHGGEDYLTKHKASRAQNKGKITLPGVGDAEFTQEVAYMLPDKLKDNLELSVAGQKIAIITVMNGDTVSITAGGNPVEVTDNIKKAIKDARHMMTVGRLVPLLKDKGFELSIFGEAKVEDKPAIGVRVAMKDKKDLTLFFDKKTNLLVKIEHRTIEAATGNEINEERIIQEYKNNKDGVPSPKKVLVKHDGKTFLEAESVEFTYLESIDENEFKK